MFNHSSEEFKINKGDRVAQLICEKIFYPDIIEVEVGEFFKHSLLPSLKIFLLQSLDDTERGSNGFGSTGAN